MLQWVGACGHHEDRIGTLSSMANMLVRTRKPAQQRQNSPSREIAALGVQRTRIAHCEPLDILPLRH